MTNFNRREITHPVLAPNGQDYPMPAAFKLNLATANRNEDANELQLGLIYHLQQQDLLDLLNSNKATYTSVIDCVRTHHRYTHQSNLSHQEIILKADRFNGPISVSAFITATENLPAFTASGWSAWLKQILPLGLDLPQGSILAIADPWSFNTDRLETIQSCLDIIPSDTMEQGHWDHSLEQDHIEILLNPQDKAQIDKLRSNEKLQGNLWPSIYLSAITHAVRSCLKEEHQGKTWAKIITDQLSTYNINTEDPDIVTDNAHRYAQILMDLPLNRLTDQQPRGDEDE